MTEGTDRAYERARKRVEEIKGFYVALGAYVVVNIFLFVIDMLTAGGPWFFWPLFGWGIGMVFYGVSVFGIGGRFGRDWEERKIRELMEREEQARQR